MREHFPAAMPPQHATSLPQFDLASMPPVLPPGVPPRCRNSASFDFDAPYELRALEVGSTSCFLHLWQGAQQAERAGRRMDTAKLNPGRLPRVAG